MEIAGLIVKIRKDFRDSIVRNVENMPNVSIHSISENQIVLLLDTSDIKILANRTKEIEMMQGVTGVYPVFSTDSLSP